MNKKNHDHPNVIALPPMILLFYIILGFSFHVLVPTPSFFMAFLPSFFQVVGILFFSLGILLVLWTARVMNKAETNINPYKPVLHFVTSGPFSFSRNPIYLGFLFVFLGTFLFAKSVFGFLFFIPLLLTLHFGVVLREEAYLLEKFNAEYKPYLEKTRRWL